MDVIINGVFYSVGVVSVRRSIRRADKYRITTEDGITHSEVASVYMDFTLVMGNVDQVAYDALMDTLRAAVGDVTIVIPSAAGTPQTYTGTFSGITDSLLLDGGVYDNLSITFQATRPEVIA